MYSSIERRRCDILWTEPGRTDGRPKVGWVRLQPSQPARPLRCPAAGISRQVDQARSARSHATTWALDSLALAWGRGRK
jgi:hypothetical protein